MTVVYTIVEPELGDDVHPEWAQQITEAVNDHETRTAELEAGSYVGEDVEATTSAASTGTEAFSGATVTWLAVSSRRYRIMAVGTHASSVLGDVSRLRIRTEAGASVTSSGTQRRIITVRAEVAGSGAAFVVVATVTGLSGQVTAGVSIQRVAGTGSCTINSNATDETYIGVERVA
jgi:hypothetical protein